MHADCHIHMLLDGVDYRAAIQAHRNAVCDALIHARLERYAALGIDYLRDGGDAFGVAKRASQLAGAYGIEYRTPLFPICRKGRYGAFIGRTFSDIAEYRALVREVLEEGGDFIKLMLSGLMDFHQFGAVTSEPLPRGEIAELIAIAHDQGLRVMAHVNGADTIRSALYVGVDSIEHGAYMDADCVSQLAESGAVWVPTLATIGNLIGCGIGSEDVLARLLAFQAENIRKCAKLGGCIAAGSDSGARNVLHGQGILDEWRILKQAIGEDAGRVLSAGEAEVRNRFRRV